eukprot:gene60898-83290_t
MRCEPPMPAQFTSASSQPGHTRMDDGLSPTLNRPRWQALLADALTRPADLLAALFFGVIALMGFVYNYPRSEKRTLAQRARTVVQASPTLLIPIIIVGSILSGLANPTESAAVGALVSALVGRYVAKEFRFRAMP